MSKYTEKETAKRSGIKQIKSRRQLIKKKTASAKRKPEPSTLKDSMKIFDEMKINNDHQHECIKAMVERAGTADPVGLVETILNSSGVSAGEREELGEMVVALHKITGLFVAPNDV
jgi:hypothetical protein